MPRHKSCITARLRKSARTHERPTSSITQRHDFGDGRARYEPASDEHHDHLIDLRTGKVIEFTSDEIEALQHAIAKKLGYRLVDHRLELYGMPLDVISNK